MFAGAQQPRPLVSRASTSRRSAKRLRPTVGKQERKTLRPQRRQDAGARTGMRAFSKLTQPRRRRASHHQRSAGARPARGALLRRVRWRLRDAGSRGLIAHVPAVRSNAEHRHLFEQLSLRRTSARKVVGVGSVGTRCLDRPLRRPRRGRPALPPGQGGPAVGARAVHGAERVRPPGPAGGRGPAPHPVGERHHARLADRRGAGRNRARLLRAPALGPEGLGRDRDDVPADDGHLRAALRRDPRPRPMPGRAIGSRSSAYLGNSDTLRQGDRPTSPAPTPTRTSATTTALTAAVADGRLKVKTEAT